MQNQKSVRRMDADEAVAWMERMAAADIKAGWKYIVTHSFCYKGVRVVYLDPAVTRHIDCIGLRDGQEILLCAQGEGGPDRFPPRHDFYSRKDFPGGLADMVKNFKQEFSL